jgi:hypothetical protein
VSVKNSQAGCPASSVVELSSLGISTAAYIIGWRQQRLVYSHLPGKILGPVWSTLK